MDRLLAWKVAGFAAFALAWTTGCSQSTSSSPAMQAATVSPEQVVSEFLEAVRGGDDQKAAVLLTALARQRTAEKEMVVAPPGSDTAKFCVRGVELAQDKAQVSTEWTDLDSDGRPQTDVIVWMLRRGDEGWRIWGMATQVFADQDKVVLNFENPDEMLKRQQLAEEEIARRERLAAPQEEGRTAPSDNKRR